MGAEEGDDLAALRAELLEAEGHALRWQHHAETLRLRLRAAAEAKASGGVVVNGVAAPAQQAEAAACGPGAGTLPAIRCERVERGESRAMATRTRAPSQRAASPRAPPLRASAERWAARRGAQARQRFASPAAPRSPCSSTVGITLDFLRTCATHPGLGLPIVHPYGAMKHADQHGISLGVHVASEPISSQTTLQDVIKMFDAAAGGQEDPVESWLVRAHVG